MKFSSDQLKKRRESTQRSVYPPIVIHYVQSESDQRQRFASDQAAGQPFHESDRVGNLYYANNKYVKEER